MKTKLGAVLCALAIAFGATAADATPANAGIASAFEKIARRLNRPVVVVVPMVETVRPNWSASRFLNWLKNVEMNAPPKVRRVVRRIVVERRVLDDDSYNEIIKGTICDTLEYVMLNGEFPDVFQIQSALTQRLTNNLYNAYLRFEWEKNLAAASSVHQEVQRVVDMDIPTASAEVVRYLWCR